MEVGNGWSKPVLSKGRCLVCRKGLALGITGWQADGQVLA